MVLSSPKILKIVIISIICFSSIILLAQENNSVVSDDKITVNSNGIAFLGSGTTEEDAKIIAVNDAKRKALEQTGMYLESHVKVIDHTLVKDEIITISGSILNTKTISENRKIINNIFAFEVEIETTIDINILNERITYIKENRELEEQLELEKQRNEKLAKQIRNLQNDAGTVQNENVKKLVNSLSANEWNRLSLQQVNPNKKIEYLTQAILLDPDYVIAYYNRGTAYYEMSKYAESIEDFDKAIELNPHYGKAYNNRGVVHSSLGSYEKAIDDFKRAFELNPHIVTIFNNRGAAYNKLGKNDLAIRDFNRAIEINSHDASAYNNRAIAYNELRQYRAALQDFSKSIELNPKDATVYFNRGSTYLQLKMYPEAFRDFTQVIQINPDDASAYKIRGVVSTLLGNNQEAVDDLNDYLKLSGHQSKEADQVRQMIINLGFSPKY